MRISKNHRHTRPLGCLAGKRTPPRIIIPKVSSVNTSSTPEISKIPFAPNFVSLGCSNKLYSLSPHPSVSPNVIGLLRNFERNSNEFVIHKNFTNDSQNINTNDGLNSNVGNVLLIDQINSPIQTNDFTRNNSNQNHHSDFFNSLHTSNNDNFFEPSTLYAYIENSSKIVEINPNSSLKLRNTSNLPHLSSSTNQILPKISKRNNTFKIDNISVLNNLSKKRKPEQNFVILDKEEEENKLQILKALLEIVNDPIKRKNISLQSVDCLALFLKKYIFRPIPKINVSCQGIQCSESKSYYELRYIKHISIMHSIFHSLLNDIAVFGEYINETLVKNLFEMLQSPVLEERKLFEKDLEVILLNYSSLFKKLIFKLMTAKINLCIDGIYFAGIDSILRLMRRYFGHQNEPINQNNLNLFRISIFPLITSHQFSEFETPFHELSKFFVSQSQATAQWALKYLSTHFPISNQHKQKAFLKHIDVLLPHLPPSMLTVAANDMLVIFGSAFASNSTDSIVAASMMLMDDGFIGLFKCVPESTCKYLMTPLVEATKSCKEISREMATQICEKLRGVEKKNVLNEDADKLKEQTWKEIRKAAADSL
ncbi:hypothetical protein TRFO_38347 [Tritrichomonas foetus]|uniref:Uncharacterized protein n=1 Tax=Tritrichomonas foetus TaxID=1144522 RepID=A0A1J4JE51_9EUKA|nr:hypothetical protein TRFO_38347 [Tritrichomonas foetus]|eukprot:OHS95532.1 hypothetical protein TRFO_38347 [Tritrichomonas foetus]